MPVHTPGVENALTDIPSRSFGSNPEWLCNDDSKLLTLFSHTFPLPEQASWATFRFTTKMIMHVISVLRMTDITLDEWRATTKNRATHLGHWTNYIRPLGLDPYLQGVGYTTRVRVLTGFAARVRRGVYGRGKRVQAGAVIDALVAVGQEIALACGENPTKLIGSDKLLPRLQQTYDGWQKEDPATTKQLPVEADVPNLLADRGRRALATEQDRAVGDLTLIAFHYLLWIGKYTIKGNRNETKQTVQFKRCNSNGRT
jgi:hypothetical protein